MREYVISSNDAGQRADRFLRKAAPDLPFSLLQKAFRTKDVKCGRERCLPDRRLEEGDVVRLYAREPKAAARRDRPFLLAGSPELDIVYEDGSLIVVNKPAGLPSQPDESEPVHNLAVRIQAYLYGKGEWDPDAENSFSPALCHRLDRGTAGLVMAAKTAGALRVMNEKIRLREIEKTYLAVVRGRPDPAEGLWEDFLYKDAASNTVFVHGDRSRGAKTAAMRYRSLRSEGGLTLLECTLITGRTHQIRVQCADRGFPLVGDGKYGREGSGRRHGSQALLSWRIKLCFSSPAGELEPLRGKVFEAGESPGEFFEKYC